MFRFQLEKTYKVLSYSYFMKIEYEVKTMNINDPKSMVRIKVPYKQYRPFKEALDSGKKLKVTIEVIENEL